MRKGSLGRQAHEAEGLLRGTEVRVLHAFGSGLARGVGTVGVRQNVRGEELGSYPLPSSWPGTSTDRARQRAPFETTDGG